MAWRGAPPGGVSRAWEQRREERGFGNQGKGREGERWALTLKHSASITTAQAASLGDCRPRRVLPSCASRDTASEISLLLNRSSSVRWYLGLLSAVKQEIAGSFQRLVSKVSFKTAHAHDHKNPATARHSAHPGTVRTRTIPEIRIRHEAGFDFQTVV